MSDAQIAVLAARQLGLITRAQARRLGLSDRAIEWRIGVGRWLVVRRGVYAIAGVPPSQEQAVLAAVLAAGGATLASHLTAAALWGLGFPLPSEIHLLTDPSRRLALDGVRQHRTGTLHPHDAAHRSGVPVTSPARTLTDCSGTVDRDRLEAIVDDAERRRLIRIDELRTCVDRLATGPGRRPTVAIRATVTDRLPVGESPREKRLLQDLLRRGVPMPVLGHPVTVKGRTYRLDMAWPWAKTSLEYESWEFHHGFRAFHRGHERARRIRAEGWDLWPVTSRTDVDELARDLLRCLCGGSTSLYGVDPPQSA